MMPRSINISGKISGNLLAVLEGISLVADSLQIPFFVVGATARDIILHYGFGLEIRRATQDIDVGVRVENWEEFGLISAKLIESGLFVQTREAQRVYFKETFPVDILPFGRISEPEETISWPQSEGVGIVAGILSPASKKYIINILDAETGLQDRYRFVEDMREGYAFVEEDFNARQALLESFKAGFIERA